MILVVVLGGIGLSGGKGGIRNVIVGTLLIGVLLNGMTIMDIQYTVQNVIKGIILLTAIVIDTILNPRDEQTAQQGDIYILTGRKNMRLIKTTLLAAAVALGAGTALAQEGIDDPTRAPYYDSFDGKTGRLRARRHGLRPDRRLGAGPPRGA